ncbi:hypothetical protein F5148DRAFT_327704 [Russula earlei]|uniref:Uncharacterized protein n=1 Tax=Russula earlei TaxID=71964 RepID=A0ACC0UIE1_9AGAM|nr:hypothetical protein F5148DRAFT_327704 [Russula earlei]
MGTLLIVSQPFPLGHNGGQTFASTLLLSFSCAPLLKQHILHTLSMTNEELASFEPIIAQAWDQWDRQRRLHYSQQAQAAAGAGQPSDGQPLGEVAPPPPPYTYAAAVELGDAQTTAQPFPPPDPNQHSTPQANGFRARFHCSLVTPSLCPRFLCPPF